MAEKKMESYVNCPECGELLPMTLISYQNEAGSGLLAEFEKMIGIGKSEHFRAENKCRCGKSVIATLHTTAKANHEKGVDIEDFMNKLMAELGEERNNG